MGIVSSSVIFCCIEDVAKGFSGDLVGLLPAISSGSGDAKELPDGTGMGTAPVDPSDSMAMSSSNSNTSGSDTDDQEGLVFELSLSSCS